MESKPKKPKKNFKDVFKRYKTYDTSEGFGSVSDWNKAFKYRMGVDEAKTFVGDNSPLDILDFVSMPTLNELKAKYRQIMMKNQHWHRQDASEDDQKKLKEVIGAYTILENKLNPATTV
jgi:hypothetical protein